MTILKKFLSVALFAVIMVVTLFSMTACNLITTDKTAYYNQIVATFKFDDKTIEVSMMDLNDAFKNYGYSRFNQGYYSTLEECLNDSLKYHIQKELLLFEIANTLSDVYNNTDNELYNLSFIDFENYDWDKTLENIYSSNNPNALEIRHNAFNGMQENVDALAEEILKEDEEFAEIEDAEEEEGLRAEKEEYESKVNIIDDYDDVNNQRVITIEKNIEELALFNKTDIAQHYSLINNYDEVVTAKAYNRYIKALQQTAKSENRSTKIEDVISVEEASYIKNAYQNKLLELYQYWYESNLDISTDDVIEYYKNQYKAQLDTFEYNIDAYRTAMDEYNSEYVYYHNNAGNEYIIVNHILISFTEEQKHLISELDKDLESNKKLFANDPEKIELLEDQYNKDLMSIILNTKSKYMDGEEEKEAYISEIIDEISTYVSTNNLQNAGIMSERDILIQKSKNFEDMMYKYNDDPGVMNSDFYYAVNINDGVEDNWEAEFTKGALELYNNSDEYSAGSVLARPAISSYGIHIMFYSQMAENIVAPESIDTLTIETLVDSKVNTASDKTIFEYIYDQIAEDNYYDNYVSGTINQLYNNSEIKIDSYKFKNLWQ